MKYIITALISALLALLLTKEYYPNVRITTIRDTVTIQTEPIVLEKVKPELVYIRDTIIKTKPFVATVDTIYKRDTITVNYHFPKNEMNMAIRMATDTLQKDVKTIELPCDEGEWWHSPAAAAGGLIIGIIISK